MSNEEFSKIAVFQRKEIRKQLHNGEWWFVINDITTILTDLDNPAQYLRNRNEELSIFDTASEEGVVQIEPPLALPKKSHGKKRELKG